VVLLVADAGWKYLGSPAFTPEAHPLSADAGPLAEEEEDALDDVVWW
jgi:hypothetical protein